MHDRDCVEFLQWALPKMNRRWRGFRKVRRQVCRKVQKRMDELGIEQPRDYQAYLQRNRHEWRRLESFLPITISRFWRDKGVFEWLQSRFLPELAGRVRQEGSRLLSIWSVGAGAGEEPYTLSILWRERLQEQFPEVGLSILAWDIEPHQLARAETARYPPGTLKDLPAPLVNAAFVRSDDDFQLQPEYRRDVVFEQRDILTDFPQRRFHLIACRYLAFTYFTADLQRQVARRLYQALSPGGLLVLGTKESLPVGVVGFERVLEQIPIYRRKSYDEEQD